MTIDQPPAGRVEPPSEIEDLQERLRIAEETLQAIRSGEVDALLVQGPHGEQVFTLQGADYGFRMLVEQTTEGAALVTGQGMVLYSNAALTAMARAEPDRIRGASLCDFVAPSDRARLNELLAQALRGSSQGELRLGGPGGPLHLVHCSLSRIATEPPETLAVVVTSAEELSRAREAEARALRAEAEVRALNEELERRVAERMAQFQYANHELEAFTYSVSHDLRAPLRAIEGFSQAVLEDYGEQLPPDGQEYLRRVCAAVDRMNQLTEDLLHLSRLTRGALRVEPVELSTLARQVADELQGTQPGRAVTWEIADGIMTQGDPILLRSVLENLLGNAWKFTRPVEHPCIRFAATVQDGRPAYFVQDNGVGFDPAYAEKLFGAFQRLHPVSEFEGSGIGLATVQRIVHRHGGRVWAEGAVGQGATFSFTLGAPTGELSHE